MNLINDMLEISYIKDQKMSMFDEKKTKICPLHDHPVDECCPKRHFVVDLKKHNRKTVDDILRLFKSQSINDKIKDFKTKNSKLSLEQPLPVGKLCNVDIKIPEEIETMITKTYYDMSTDLNDRFCITIRPFFLEFYADMLLPLNTSFILQEQLSGCCGEEEQEEIFDEILENELSIDILDKDVRIHRKNEYYFSQMMY